VQLVLLRAAIWRDSRMGYPASLRDIRIIVPDGSTQRLSCGRCKKGRTAC
jgi:hypothetical protein